MYLLIVLLGGLDSVMPFYEGLLNYLFKGIKYLIQDYPLPTSDFLKPPSGQIESQKISLAEQVARCACSARTRLDLAISD